MPCPEGLDIPAESSLADRDHVHDREVTDFLSPRAQGKSVMFLLAYEKYFPGLTREGSWCSRVTPMSSS